MARGNGQATAILYGEFTPSERGNTALTEAVTVADLPLAKLLIEHGARADCYDAIEDEEVLQIKAAITFNDPQYTSFISDWEKVQNPGDEESYDDALAAAVEQARAQLLVAIEEQLELSSAKSADAASEIEDLILNTVNTNDMPVSR